MSENSANQGMLWLNWRRIANDQKHVREAWCGIHRVALWATNDGAWIVSYQRFEATRTGSGMPFKELHETSSEGDAVRVFESWARERVPPFWSPSDALPHNDEDCTGRWEKRSHGLYCMGCKAILPYTSEALWALHEADRQADALREANLRGAIRAVLEAGDKAGCLYQVAHALGLLATHSGYQARVREEYEAITGPGIPGA